MSDDVFKVIYVYEREGQFFLNLEIEGVAQRGYSSEQDVRNALDLARAAYKAGYEAAVKDQAEENKMRVYQVQLANQEVKVFNSALKAIKYVRSLERIVFETENIDVTPDRTLQHLLSIEGELLFSQDSEIDNISITSVEVE